VPPPLQAAKSTANNARCENRTRNVVMPRARPTVPPSTAMSMREVDYSDSRDVSANERREYALAQHTIRCASDSASEPRSQNLFLLARGKYRKPCGDQVLLPCQLNWMTAP
jgi:hypothetical protein